ncbi:MAG TPA: hypothetical protein VL068_07900, partial [Microthrixaceae bacterium]|nr:hypothetical protein [Microthrixaceae bacterium]
MRRLAKLAIAGCALAMVAATACAPTPTSPPGRYVKPTGTDAGACATAATACATITYAVSVATPGQTIRVAAGTYPELVIVDKD